MKRKRCEKSEEKNLKRSLKKLSQKSPRNTITKTTRLFYRKNRARETKIDPNDPKMNTAQY